MNKYRQVIIKVVGPEKQQLFRCKMWPEAANFGTILQKMIIFDPKIRMVVLYTDREANVDVQSK